MRHILKDLRKNNFLVQWHPESLAHMRVPLSRPRVYMNDLELVHEFAPEVPPEERLLTGLPMVGYRPHLPPEVLSGSPYDPFKVDVWQFADDLSDFSVRETSLLTNFGSVPTLTTASDRALSRRLTIYLRR